MVLIHHLLNNKQKNHKTLTELYRFVYVLKCTRENVRLGHEVLHKAEVFIKEQKNIGCCPVEQYVNTVHLKKWIYGLGM